MNGNSVAVGPNSPSRESAEARQSKGNDDAELEDSAEAQDALAGHDREFSKKLLLSTPRGSQVSLVDDSGRRYIGTLLSADVEDVELMNCVSKEVVPGPNGQKQCKTSHVPFQSLDTSSLTHFILVSPPPPDNAPQDLAYDSSDVTVEALVYKSGGRQRWGRPLERSESAPATDAAEEQ
jgi:hypothetical protein